MPDIRCLQIDAFTDRPFAGNPAAVCLLEQAHDEQWMQNVAAEMNLAETAFVRRDGDVWALRWFTPVIEVELCGHATLASAHALWSTGLAARDEPIRFRTRSGILTCTRQGELIEMDFPAVPPVPADPPAGLIEALDITPSYVGRSKYDKFVVVESEPVLRSLKPDFAKLRELPMRGVIVTSGSQDGRFDFLSRFFAPAAGIDEDPVTGSAHCCLAPFWAERLDKTSMTGFQASKRGGVVQVRIAGDRVILGGQAVTVLDGRLV
jgi:PhzF family phenazine biosynthesis protein